MLADAVAAKFVIATSPSLAYGTQANRLIGKGNMSVFLPLDISPFYTPSFKVRYCDQQQQQYGKMH
jgi:hypothetical protein